MDRLQKTRLGWIKAYQKIQNAGIVCRRYGISRATLRKWLKRYEKDGIDGLKENSRVPHNSTRKVTEEHEKLILSIRRVQMDVCKIAGNLYQYTSIDDCTRYKVLERTIPELKKIQENYDSTKEPFTIQNYKYDQEFKVLTKQKNIRHRE